MIHSDTSGTTSVPLRFANRLIYECNAFTGEVEITQSKGHVLCRMWQPLGKATCLVVASILVKAAEAAKGLTFPRP